MTPRERDALLFIASYIEEHRWPPNVREVAAGLGLASSSQAHRLMLSLIEQGHLERGSARSAMQIRITYPHTVREELRAHG